MTRIATLLATLIAGGFFGALIAGGCGGGHGREEGPDRCPHGTEPRSIEHHEYGASDVTIVCSDGTVIVR